MTNKFFRRFLVYFSYLITFGLIHLWYKKKARELALDRSNFKVSEHTDVNIEQLVLALGKIKNISEVTASINRLQLVIHDKSKVSQQKLKGVGVKGMMFSSNKLTLLFGDDSQHIAKLLNNKITLNSKNT